MGNAFIMAWLMRWAAEIISKHAPGDDGRTPYERIRNETCAVPFVPFGEIAMYLPMKTASRNQGEATKKLGIWLSTIERIEETIIGIEHGVTKCRTINRLSNEERWQKELVNNMKGVPWEFVPGRRGQHIPVEIQPDGRIFDEHEENQLVLGGGGEEVIDEADEIDLRSKVHLIHISRTAITKYGPIEGCPACNWLNKWGH